MNNQGINTSPNSLRRRFFLLVILAAFGSVSIVRAQTSSFTYQGRLTDGATAVDATYDMQFKLFDSPTVGAGNQIGSTITNGTVLVNSGVFTVQLDFGAAAFSGADRYLEIGVRRAGDNSAHTLLSPRQQLTSAVYAIRAGSATNADTATNASTATNATQLGGVAASQYVQTNDARLTDARTPTAGSSDYIQNTNSQQAANFNISGNGTAGGTLSAQLVNTNTSYNLGGSPVLSIGSFAISGNTFTGIEAGAANSGIGLVGTNNSFYGAKAGAKNTTGDGNSFFGFLSGRSTTTGSFNAFFGAEAGRFNDVGRDNAFVGWGAGINNTSGTDNVFIGRSAGGANVTGSGTVFIGSVSGGNNQGGFNVTTIGHGSAVGQGLTLHNATAIGALALVSQSNSLVLGNIDGVNGATEDTNVGIGTTAPKSRLHIQVNGNGIHLGNVGCAPGVVGLGFGTTILGCANFALGGDALNTSVNRPQGGTLFFSENNVAQMVISPGGAVTIAKLASGGTTEVCRNPSGQFATCGSSLRYKTNVQPFISGLSVLNRLRPITFDWKDGGMHDLGFGAEEIAAVEPLLVTRNNKGEVEGVKYDRITAVLVNAVKEQQEQIRQQQAQLKQQQQQINSLRSLVVKRHARASARRR